MTVQLYGNVIKGDVRGSKVSNTGSHMVKPLLSCPCWILEAVFHGFTLHCGNCLIWLQVNFFSTPNLFPQLNQTLMLKKMLLQSF